jgi:hypothetical protein
MIRPHYVPPDTYFDDPVDRLDLQEADEILPYALAGEALHRVFEWIMRGDVQQRSLRFHLVALCLFPRLLPCKRPSVAWCGKIHGVSREWARRLRQDFAQQFDGKMRFPRRTARHKEEQDEEAKLTCKSNGLPLLLLHGNAHGYRGKSNRAKPDYRSSGCPESSSSPRRNESR